MDRRAFLYALSAGTGYAFAPQAFALAPFSLQVSATRASPALVKLDWTGANGPVSVLVATTPYSSRGLKRLATSAAPGAEVQAASEPRPYFLVRSKAGESWTAERLLPLKGGRNFRDLGGYRTEDGKQVRWGKLYRSGVMSGLTDADMDYLAKLGVGVVCDLRNVDERKADPTPFLKLKSAKVAAFDYQMTSGLEGLAQVRTRDQAVGAFAEAYVGFLDLLTPHYSDLFARLVKGEAPLAFNCSAGKDRTGTAAALILSVLGVPRETVVADYALTQVYTPPALYAQQMASGAPTPGLTPEMAQAMRQLPPEVLQVILGSDPAVMSQTLARIDQRFGGPVQLVKAKFGVTEAGVRRMRSLYLV